MFKEITKCANGDCPLRPTCYRTLVKGDIMQSWDRFSYDKETKVCDFYIEIKEGVKL